MRREALEEYLSAYLGISSIKDYCPNGLQIEGRSEITKIATGVTADLVTVQQAIIHGVDALIVHHGLFWNHDPYPLTGVKKEKVSLLLCHGISLFAYHLPLDAHPMIGNNWGAARALGWEGLTPFGECNGIPIGVKGESPCSPSRYLWPKWRPIMGNKPQQHWEGRERSRMSL